ncbi:FAD-dependent urate hydroxylase [Nymphaea thermarum]|nr:FAD-dependent urate hydroxylase [Nymphaea thermarum]
MEVSEDLVIVGAGIGGVATALGLHRLGLRSLVLESADSLRASGFALTQWSNAWKAMDALGVGGLLRQHHPQLRRLTVTSNVTGETVTDLTFTRSGESNDVEVRCVSRQMLVETLSKQLPQGTIRFGSKVVSIEQDRKSCLIHLADGTLIRAKVLIGCDGVNSVVAKWLGLPGLVSTGRSSIRGLAHYPEGHGFEPRFAQFFGNGARFGILPCDERTIYWFCTLLFNPQDDATTKDDPLKLREIVLSGIEGAPEAVSVVEHTDLNSIMCSPLRYRSPWTMLWGHELCKGKVTVIGDAMHPMTPDIGQGGCSALEDAVVLVRCLGEALLGITGSEEQRDQRVKEGLEKYVKQRRGRWFRLILTAYWVGRLQQSGGTAISFLRNRFMVGMLSWVTVQTSMFDCGKLQG